MRDGSLFEPVIDERFDLIATNPPFVISPGTGERLVYRDSGLPGDGVVEHIVRAAPDHLTDGGWCQVLTNWVIARDRPWDERLGAWLSDGCDALVGAARGARPRGVRRAVAQGRRAARCARLPRPVRRLAVLARRAGRRGRSASAGSTCAGARTGSAGRTGSWTGRTPSSSRSPRRSRPGAPPSTVEVGPDDLLVRRDDVHQETVGVPGAEDPTTVVLRQQRGLMRARRADTVEAALVGACDGDLTVGQILDALAQLLDRDAGELHATYLPVVRELVEEGFLTT